MKSVTVIIGLLLLLINSVAVQAETKVWYFDNDKADTITKDFTSEAGEWKVIADDTTS